MIRKLIILILILSYCLSSCNEIDIKENTKNNLKNNFQIDTSRIAIIQLDSSTNSMLKIFSSIKTTELTADDLRKIETILTNFTEDYNPEREKHYYESKAKYPNYDIDIKNFVIDLKRYKRQYFATTNEKGEKEVWVNCFCDRWDDWRKKLVYVIDGGNCYFNIKINLKTGHYYNLRINAIA